MAFDNFVTRKIFTNSQKKYDNNAAHIFIYYLLIIIYLIIWKKLFGDTFINRKLIFFIKLVIKVYNLENIKSIKSVKSIKSFYHHEIRENWF